MSTDNTDVIRSFEMYTKEGNRSIEMKLRRCEQNMSNARTYADQSRAIEKFILSYRNMVNYKRYAGVLDTAVRELVYYHLEKSVKRFCGVSDGRANDMIDIVWEKYI